jgi:hypothetical protein
MTDMNTLSDIDIKHYGKLSSNQVSCYQYSTKCTLFDSESIPSCFDRECGNDHSFRDNIKDAIMFIDLLSELFPEIFKENRNGGISITKLQEFVN